MEQEQKDKVIDALLTIAEHIGEYGLNELEAALHYKRQVAKSSHPVCDPGWTWSELQQKCVRDIG